MNKNVVAPILIISLLTAISTTTGFAKEVKIVNIVPKSDVTRLKRVAVGNSYANTTSYPDSKVPADGALIEGQVALGHGGLRGSPSSWLATGSLFPILTLNSCEMPEVQDSNYLTVWRKHSITMTAGAGDYWHIAAARNTTNPVWGEMAGEFQIRQGDIAAGSDKTCLTILNEYGYDDARGNGWMGVGTETPKGKLDLNPTSGQATGALIVPRMPADPANPVAGMIYYNTMDNMFKFYQAGAGWKKLTTVPAT